MLRKITNDDVDTCLAYLDFFGVPSSESCLEGNETYLLEDDNRFVGFFTLKKDKNELILQHFVVAPNYEPSVAYQLIQEVKKIAHIKGCSRIIVPIKISQKWLAKLMLYYSRKLPIVKQNFLYFQIGV